MYLTVPLSRLTTGRRNPRKVSPDRQAHRRLVASIRSYGLLEPLIVQPCNGSGYRVIAGKRRLEALRDVHRGAEVDPEIACEVHDVDAVTADALSLSENFARERMHPLDEAEAFAKLASVEFKGVATIAAEFGVSRGYVRQRMKLAMLADIVKFAYRSGDIDTETAEAFAAVPPERQLEVWDELDGKPHNGQHVRAVLENGWIDAQYAMFDVDTLADGAVSRDLFQERVLIERKAFLSAQADALIAEQEALIEDGWNEVVIAAYADVQDRVWSMAPAEGEVDEKTVRQVAVLDDEQEKLEAKLNALDNEDEAECAIYERIRELDEQREELLNAATVHFTEAVKSQATVFLMTCPDGRIRREYRVPRRSETRAGGNGEAGTGQQPPTSDDLVDRQKAVTYTMQALAVRTALLEDRKVRRLVLALLLHDKVRIDGLTVRHQPNTTDLHAEKAGGVEAGLAQVLHTRQAEVDPLGDDHFYGTTAYQRLLDMPDDKLDALIDVLTVRCLIADLHRPTELVSLLARNLNVDLRQCWRPDAEWLSGYKRIQLAHLIGELCGPVYVGVALKRKKSELVEQLAKLFTDAAEGRLADPQLAERVNAWLPANVREGLASDEAVDAA